ncbi:MAG: hypothetical protein OEY26_00030 [Nitrospinota bacterium]|nr:hypothetical protein [Nitrospinota bacterium]
MNKDQDEKMSEFATAMTRIVRESGMDPHEAYALMVYYGIQRTAEERGMKEAWEMVMFAAEGYGNLQFGLSGKEPGQQTWN